MGTCSLAFYHKTSNKNYQNIYEACKLMGINIFESDNLCQLIEISKIVQPMFVMIDSENLNEEILENYIKSHKSKYFFILSDKLKYQTDHSYISQDSDEIVELFCKKYRNLYFKEQDPNIFLNRQNMITEYLKDLGFSAKHLGMTYLKELITEISCDRTKAHTFYNKLYIMLSTKYCTTPDNIERTIRFSIKHAFKNNPEKILMTTNRIDLPPTIKEVSNYILDKIILQKK